MKIKKFIFIIWFGFCTIAFLLTDNPIYIVVFVGFSLILNGLIGFRTKKVSGLKPRFGIIEDEDYKLSFLMIFFGLFWFFIYFLSTGTY